jgi:hypothetical protein
VAGTELDNRVTIIGLPGHGGSPSLSLLAKLALLVLDVCIIHSQREQQREQQRERSKQRSES